MGFPMTTIAAIRMMTALSTRYRIASTMAGFTDTEYRPEWHAQAHCGHLESDNTSTGDQIIGIECVWKLDMLSRFTTPTAGDMTETSTHC
jgi:hypothetical protein